MISLSRVTKIYRRKKGWHFENIVALNCIDLEINKGEIIGYIGPNGAGKSTTIKVMTGVLKPDTGKCYIDGKIPWKSRKEVAKEIGVVFGQKTQLWWDLPVVNSYELIKDIYGISDYDYKQRMGELSALLDIESILDIPPRQLSLGQRMKCDIVASLLHNPKVLFLDEPTIGLDSPSKLSIRKFIKDINHKYKTTIVLTTHDMSDIEALADRIILIGNGKILFDTTKHQFKKMFTGSTSLDDMIVKCYKEFGLWDH